MCANNSMAHTIDTDSTSELEIDLAATEDLAIRGAQC
jgi:hypothetical protein